MSNFVLLGPILLQGFEIPQQITWGGRQKLAIHTLPGGDRVIDSLGRNDIDISWSGVFSGPTASSRARTVDRMRADGATWPLTWSTFFYSVVIKSFAVDYTRANWLPYQISCTVLRDETARFTAAEPPLTAQVLGDVSAANGLAIGVDLSAALGLIAASGAATLGTDANAAASASLQTANADLDAAIQLQQLALQSTAVATAQTVTANTQSAGNLAALVTARAFMRRALANIHSAGT